MTPHNQTTTRHPSRIWKTEWDQELIEGWPKGISQLEFSRRFGVSPYTVMRHAKRLGLLPHLTDNADA